MSGAFSLWHILLVAFLILVLFGRGKVSDLMADVAKGVRQFKKGMAEEEDKKEDEPKKPSDFH